MYFMATLIKHNHHRRHEHEPQWIACRWTTLPIRCSRCQQRNHDEWSSLFQFSYSRQSHNSSVCICLQWQRHQIRRHFQARNCDRWYIANRAQNSICRYRRPPRISLAPQHSHEAPSFWPIVRSCCGRHYSAEKCSFASDNKCPCLAPMDMPIGWWYHCWKILSECPKWSRKYRPKIRQMFPKLT